MDDQSPAPHAPVASAAAQRRRGLWPLLAVAVVAVVGAGAGAYFGLRGAAGPGSGVGAGPPARAFAAAAYDEASHQVVLFGGVGAQGSALDDTWTWDGSAWAQRHPATSPPARGYAAMTYDPKAHDVVLVGGRSAGYSPTTVCSGSITAGGPNATPGVAHPPVACNASPPSQFSDTWVWDGSTWHPKGAAPAALVGQTPALGTDPTTGQVLMLAESSPAAMSPACPVPAPSFAPGTPIPQAAIPCGMAPPTLVATWVWNGTSWAALTSGSSPSGPGVALAGLGGLAADPTSGHLVDVTAAVQYSCGGASSPATSAPCPLSSPPVEGSTGGSGSAGGKGIASPSTPAPTPPPASGGPIAANSATAQPVPMPTILPAPGRATCCSDTVTTWTGTSWSNPRTFSSGPPVIPSGIAGDPAQHEIVAVTAQGTWTWNGSTWKAEHSPISPPAAAGGVLVYDGASGKLLLFGGELTPVFKSSSQPPAFRVTDGLWTWDGTGWAQLTGAAASPPPSAPPTPTPTFLPPITPAPVSPPPTGVPVPTPRTVPCTPTPAPTPPPAPALTPAPTQGPGAGPNSGFGCATVLVPPASG